MTRVYLSPIVYSIIYKTLLYDNIFFKLNTSRGLFILKVPFRFWIWLLSLFYGLWWCSHTTNNHYYLLGSSITILREEWRITTEISIQKLSERERREDLHLKYCPAILRMKVFHAVFQVKRAQHIWKSNLPGM